MYYPPLFTPVRPFDPRANPLEVPVGRENPLDLSVKTIRPSSDTGVAEADDLLMLDHRKLANLAASHSLSAMGRQLLDPTLFRLGYGTDAAAAAAAMLPGLTPPFCYDRTTGVAVPTSLAGHQIMSSYFQQRERLEHQHQQALYAARTSAVAQQQAAVAAAAVAYMDPANLPLHLRNGLTQREAAAALAATRGLYAPTLPAPMVLPAFSLYTDDKGAFTSLRNSGRDNATEKNFMNGTQATSAPSLEAARYAEHFQRLRDLQQQHQASGKCNNACCTTNTLSGLGQSSVPCACCVQTPSQAALCARSPMGCSAKDPASAATGKVCDFVQPSLSFLHRPTATTSVTTTASSSSSEIRLSVSSLCTTQTTSEPTTVSSSRDKHQSNFRPTTIWNAGLPSVSATTTTSSSNKTAFTVPKRKESSTKEHHKEHKTSGSIKDILKDNHNSNSASFDTSKYDSYMKTNNTVTSKSDNLKRNHEKNGAMFMNEDFSSRYYSRESSDVNPFVFHRAPAVIPPKSTTSNLAFTATSTTTTVTSTSASVPSKNEVGSIPISKLPPLLEAVRPAEPKVSLEVPQETPTTIPSPQGPPPLIAVSSAPDHLSSVTSSRSLYQIPENLALRMPTSVYPAGSLLLPPYKHSVEKSTSETTATVKISSSKSPKKSTSSSHSYPKFNGLTSNFGSEEPQPPSAPISLPKPIPQLPTHHLVSSSAPLPFSSHYRPAQHQLNLQNHNGWIPAANPNVTVAPIPQPVTTATTITTTSSTPVVTTSHQSVKPQQASFTPTIKREPDYADTANVLQSLLIRPAPGLETLTTIPPSTGTGMATSVVTPTNNLPLFGLDYRYPFPHQLLMNREGLPTASINCAPTTQITGSAVPSMHRDNKTEIPKVENANHSSMPPFSKHSSSKKRPIVASITDETASCKKRLVTPDFIPTHNQPRYPFQPTTFASEAAEAPECPYTFIPEPPLNFSGQFKSEDCQKFVRKEVPVEKPQEFPEAPHAVVSKSPQIVPPTSSPQPDPPCPSQLPSSSPVSDRVKAIRAKRRLRKKLLARIYQQRRPLLNGTVAQPDPSIIGRQLAVRYTRKLLSQLTLRWAHRRYVHKWHSIKRKSMTKVLKLKKRRKDGRLVYKIKKDTKEKKKSLLQDEPTPKVNDTIAIPPEMKRLMVNKALGETILHRAARLGYPEAVAYCLKTKCVSVNARDNAGYTPLHECCSRGHLDIARALLQYGADVNASAAGGIRPLHDAVENDHVEIVRLLLSYGADPTIATYSGLEPMKLARSPMMAEFLQGFFADISGEVDSRPHLPWRFWGSAKCLDPEDCGYDVFDGVPSDPHCEGEGDNDFLFEVSDSPHLPTFRLLLPTASTKAQCNYLRLNDVLRKLSMIKEDFLQTYSHIEVLTLPSHEFEASAMCSPLLTGTKMDAPLGSRPCSDRMMDNSSMTDLVRLDNSIRQVLGIETISVR